MMSQTFDTSQWLSFFTKAGLPPNVAANYALIFSDNRIQLDMLMDLSKEYLYDMGIRVMGDVIAILRYAKEFHTQMAKERAIGTAISPNKVVGRMVGHYTRPLRLSPKASPVNVLVDDTKTISLAPKPTKIISLKRTACDEVPIKRVRKVPPEEEGAYKIKMPLGTTERTRKILQQQQQAVQGSKRSVFTRLGDTSVSSSTDKLPKSPSVFQRLGPSSKSSSDDMPTSTVLLDTNRVKQSGQPLQYQGVLKITKNSANKRIISSGTSSRTVLKPSTLRLTTNPKVISLNRINSILQANSSQANKNSSEGIFSKSKIQPKIDVKSRLGVKFDSRNLTRTKILLNKSKNLNVKKTSNVFDRLGK